MAKRRGKRNEFEWRWGGRVDFKPSGKPISKELIAKMFNRHPDQIAARQQSGQDASRSSN